VRHASAPVYRVSLLCRGRRFSIHAAATGLTGIAAAEARVGMPANIMGHPDPEIESMPRFIACVLLCILWPTQTLAAASPEIIAGSAAAERMQTQADGWIRSFNEMTGGATGDSRTLFPNRMVDEVTELNLGGTRVVLLPSGGSHSPGDVVVWLPEARVLIPGDVVYTDRAPSMWDGRVSRWIEFLDTLIDLEPEAVIPGHGRIEGAETLARPKRYLTTLWAAVEEGVRQGLPDFETVPIVRERMAEIAADYPGFEDKVGRSVAHMYPEVEASAF
jgi:cyclase